MNAPGGPVSRSNIASSLASNYSPLSRPTYDQGSFDRVMTAAERVEPPKPAAQRTEIGSPRDEFSGFIEDMELEEGETPETEANQRFAEMPNWPTTDPSRIAANTAPVAQNAGPPSLPPDSEDLAAKLDQMGIRLSVRGLSVGDIPLPATASPPAAAAYSPVADATKGQPEIAADSSTAATETAPGEAVEAAGANDNSDSGQPNSERGDTPAEQGGSTLAGQAGSLGAAAFATLSDEAVAAVDAAGAIEESGPVHVPDGITVRVVDPEGAWEVDVMRTGSDLALILRGSQEVTDSVLRDESTLRNDLAREGWRLSQLRVEPTNETQQAVRAPTGSESAQSSTNMQSDHSEASQHQARHEEAPPWQAPRGARPEPRTLGTPTISATGRLDREI